MENNFFWRAFAGKYRLGEQALSELALEFKEEKSIQDWNKEFLSRITFVRFGYSKYKVGRFRTPDLENRLDEIATQLKMEGKFERVRKAPELILSHDIDYLQPTLQMNIKRLIRYGKFDFSENYLPSIEKLLSFDRQVLPEGEGSQLFVCFPHRSKKFSLRFRQWLLDPSYLTSEFLDGFRELVRNYNSHIGVHGSFFSLSEKSLPKEKEMIETYFDRKISSLRMHWLNLSEIAELEYIRQCGFKADSTLGWNGDVGFRLGLTYPLQIVDGLKEVPMVLMDGPLFDDLKLDENQVFELSKEILHQVKVRNGCVAIDWHDRAATGGFPWFGAYQKIVSWALEQGFQIRGRVE